MDQKLSIRTAAALGAVTLLAVILGIWALFVVGRKEGWARQRLELETTFPSVSGLRVGATVRVLGSVAGEVSAIELPTEPGHPVVVRFWVGKEHQPLLRQDAKVKLVKDGLVGERVVEVEPGTASAEPITNGARVASAPVADMDSLLTQLGGVVDDLKSGKGTLGKLLTDESLYTNLEAATETAGKTLESLGETNQALKQSWPLRKWVEDRYRILVRPDSKSQRKVFAETELFEPGRAIITRQGFAALDDLAVWLKEFSGTAEEIVLVAFASDEKDDRLADLTTTSQAEAVKKYLMETHKSHKTGWWSSRPITAVGFGNRAPPTIDGRVEKEPPRRLEVLVFIK